MMVGAERWNEGAHQNNEYKMVVVASDDAPGAGRTGRRGRCPTTRSPSTVTDVDEDGSISLSAQQPQVSIG